MLGLIFSTMLMGCAKEDDPAPRIWCIQPNNSTAETEIRQMVREFDAVAYISFVPVEDISARLSEAFELGTAPDVFMFDADMIPDLSEEKQLDDLTNRIGVSKIKTDELNEIGRAHV